MKLKSLITLIAILFYSFIQSQNYKVGDTIFYLDRTITNNKSCASYYSIIKQKEHFGDNTKYKMVGFKRVKDSTQYLLHSEYETNFAEVQSAEGFQRFYHKNGNISSEGKTKKGQSVGLWKHWYEDGKIMDERLIPERIALSKEDKNYTLKNFWSRDGKQTIINGNGTFELKRDSLFTKGFYKNGKRHGKFSGFIYDRKYFEEYYKNGKLTSGKSWDKDGKEYKYKKVFSQPRYKKGQKSVAEHLIKNFKIPRYAYENNIAGRILLNFRIRKDGKIDKIKVAKKLCDPSDKEAIRVVKMMKNWKAGKHRGQNVNVNYTLPIKYNL